jgi:anti-anti-sigma factor
MAEDKQILEHEVVEGTHVFRLQIAMLEDATALMALEDELSQLLESEESPTVIVNLGSVEYMVTTALAKLVSYRRKLCNRGGDLILCSLQGPVQEVMKITRFDELFETYEEEAEAVEQNT